MISTPLASNSSSVKQSSNSQSRLQYTQSNDSSSQHLGPQSQTNPSFPIVTHSEEYRNQDTLTTTPPTLQPVHKNTPINEMTDVEKYETAMDIPSVTPKHSHQKYYLNTAGNSIPILKHLPVSQNSSRATYPYRQLVGIPHRVRRITAKKTLASEIHPISPCLH